MDIRRITRRLALEDIEIAYRKGLFPMADPDAGLVTWHRPTRRAILPLDAVHVPRSLARRMRRGGYTVTINRDFAGVMTACADRDDTWISAEFLEVFTGLHHRGKAHSLEVWVDGLLAGGVYGVHFGAAFFAESMFHRVTDMSKIALVSLAARLAARGFRLLDVQYQSDHLARFGVVEIPNREYQRLLAAALETSAEFE
ncbi:MAG: leucyl/phenylalanyl-tRNA--protein transferase [Bryobacteraceae bacterium]